MTENSLPQLQEWLNRVAEELQIPNDVVIPGPILAMTKDVAHGVIRPGAPTSSYLVGVALGLSMAEHADDGKASTTERLQDLTHRVSELVTTVRREAGLEDEADSE